MKVIVCLLLLVAAVYADEKKTEKRGVLGLGYGGYAASAPLLGHGYYGGHGLYGHGLGLYSNSLYGHGLYGGGLYGGGLYGGGLYGHGYSAPLVSHGLGYAPPLLGLGHGYLH